MTRKQYQEEKKKFFNEAKKECPTAIGLTAEHSFFSHEEPVKKGWARTLVCEKCGLSFFEQSRFER